MLHYARFEMRRWCRWSRCCCCLIDFQNLENSCYGSFCYGDYSNLLTVNSCRQGMPPSIASVKNSMMDGVWGHRTTDLCPKDSDIVWRLVPCYTRLESSINGFVFHVNVFNLLFPHPRQRRRCKSYSNVAWCKMCLAWCSDSFSLPSSCRNFEPRTRFLGLCSFCFCLSYVFVALPTEVNSNKRKGWKG